MRDNNLHRQRLQQRTGGLALVGLEKRRVVRFEKNGWIRFDKSGLIRFEKSRMFV
jgi:hypothetical protein